jgi:hypoxanthine phosphoribosyltransferase
VAEDGALPGGARLVADATAVRAAWDRLAHELQPRLVGNGTILLGVLLGGLVPLVEIARRLRGDFVLDTCQVTRYAGGVLGGPLRWLQEPTARLQGRPVIIVDDIYDEGATLAELRRWCTAAGAAAVAVAVLARKRHPRPTVGLPPEHVGLEVGDDYVFGCGMDLAGRWRHLEAIYALPRPAASGAS